MKLGPGILILTASYGDGHVQAARSLKLAFERQGIDQVHIMDLMKEAHPLINKITTTLYIKSMLTSQFGFDYYGWSYYITRNAQPDTGWGRYVNNLGRKKLKETIDQMRPRAIVSTFPFGAVPELCRQSGIPLFTVVTDYTLHARWIHQGVYKYYVATEELKERLMSKGFSQDRVTASGIPIRKAFDETENLGAGQNPFLNRMDSQRKTILILAGSYGVLGNVDEMIHTLQRINRSQVAVVCGRNRKLEQKLRMKYEHEPHVHIYGFVENIHNLMAISSCIVTKAGGLTLSEALTLKVPIFIFKPFAGQEKENAAFLSGKGAALVSRNIGELVFQMERFLSEDAYGEHMRKQMALLQKKSAADFIVRDMLQCIRETETILI